MNLDDIRPEDKQLIAQEMEQEKAFASTLTVDDLKSGEWFVKLIQRVLQTYDKNARAAYFQQKYPGLHPDAIADKLIKVCLHHAMVAGAVSALATSASVVSSIATAGFTVTVILSTVGLELIYLARIQLLLVLDLAILYNVKLDLNDPEDVMFVFQQALQIKSNEVAGKGVVQVGGELTKFVVKKTINKGTLKTVQKMGRAVGIKILQRTIIKFAVPVVSVGLAVSFNRATTASVAKSAKQTFRGKGKAEQSLHALISPNRVYGTLYPALLATVANVDGKLSPKEQELQAAILQRMTLEDYDIEAFNQLVRDEEQMMELVASYRNTDDAFVIMELLVLMIVCDGYVDEAEERFILRVADVLGQPCDVTALKELAKEYEQAPTMGEQVKSAIQNATEKMKRVLPKKAN
jgi:uncharacterized tellurite resistance protein B-like protein